MSTAAAGARSLDVLRWRGGQARQVDDWLTEEVAVALQYNGVSHAVMLATPLDLEDFAMRALTGRARRRHDPGRTGARRRPGGLQRRAAHSSGSFLDVTHRLIPT